MDLGLMVFLGELSIFVYSLDSLLLDMLLCCCTVAYDRCVSDENSEFETLN